MIDHIVTAAKLARICMLLSLFFVNFSRYKPEAAMTLDMKAGLAVTGWPVIALINDDVEGDWILQRAPDAKDADPSIIHRLTRIGMDPVRARYTLIWTGNTIEENSTSLELKDDRPTLYDAALQAVRPAQ